MSVRGHSRRNGRLLRSSAANATNPAKEGPSGSRLAARPLPLKSFCSMPRSGPSVGIPSLLALAWLVSCGADVGGYHLAGQSDESAADASANGTGGGGSQSGGNQA